jgi:hypothetical protein
VQAGQLGLQDLADPALVRRVHVSVDQAHGNRLDVAGAELAGHGRHGLLVERYDHVAGVVHALDHLQAMAAPHERLGRVPEDVVQLLAVRPADLEDVPKAVRRHQRRARAALRDHCVRRHRRPVEERAHLGRVEAELAHALDDADVEARRGRRHLRDPRLAGLADGEDVRERAAGVAADDPGSHLRSVIRPSRRPRRP